MVAATSPIPRVIHQTWRTSTVPLECRAYQQSWRRFQPDWEHRLWTDDDNRQLLVDHYPWFLEVYDRYPEPIMRADAIRPFILHRHGGIYADLDYECRAPLAPALAGLSLLLVPEPQVNLKKGIVVERGLNRIISNALIGAEKGHPLMMAVIAHLLGVRHESGPLDATGPFAWTRAVDRFEAEHGPLPIQAEAQFNPVGDLEYKQLSPTQLAQRTQQALAVHHWHGSWYDDCPAPTIRKRLRNRIHHIRAQLGPTPAKPGRWVPVAGRRADQVDDSEGHPSVLVLSPVKNAAQSLPGFFEQLAGLDYPKHRMSLAFLEGDSQDDSSGVLKRELQRVACDYAGVELFHRDYGLPTVAERWRLEYQLERRATIAKCRNELLIRALGDHDWVLWIDADMQSWPNDVLRRLLSYQRSIINPHCVLPNGSTFDCNAFVQVEPPDPVHVHSGLHQPPKGVGRRYLSDYRDRELVELDGVGGCMLLVAGDLHRQGLVFPTHPYKQLIETEGLAAMAKDMGHKCWGLPNLEVVHHPY